MQNHIENRIIKLLNKFHDNTAKPEDIAELNRWYDSFDYDSKLTSGLNKSQLIAINKDMFQNIKNELNLPERGIRLKSRIIRPSSIAALVMAVIVALAVFLKKNKEDYSAKIDVMPGKNVAILTLNNGKQIDLNLAKSGLLTSEAGVGIYKLSGGVIQYRILHKTLENKICKNKITTPAGGQFKVVLADGTQVWLNAMSSLTFGAQTAGETRNVSLNGEGYFEVTKDRSRPFIVTTKTEQVKVLGTHFNVNAYADEGVQRTTLLEGKVQVKSLQHNSLQVTIKPGQQAEGLGNLLKVRSVDSEDASGWKDGIFVFNHTELHVLMRQFARWYNIEVIYSDKGIKPRAFSGEIDRSYTLREALNILELGNINFKITAAENPGGRKRLILIP